MTATCFGFLPKANFSLGLTGFFDTQFKYFQMRDLVYKNYF